MDSVVSTSNKSFNDLPTEILIRILTDCITNCGEPRMCINRLGLVCQKWFQITQYHVWQKENFVFCLSNVNIENNSKFISKASFRIFYNFKIKDLDFGQKYVLENLYKFLKLYNRELVGSLIILNCTITFKILCKIIEYFVNLKELHIEGCTFDSKESFPLQRRDINNISNIIKQITILGIRFNSSYNTKFFYQIAMCSHSLETFLYEEKYVAIIKERSKLSNYAEVLCAIAKNNQKTLKYLDICPVFRESKLCFKQETLNLKSLSLNGITSSANIGSILKRTKYLEDLNISFIFDFASPEIDIDTVLQRATSLKSLKLEFMIVDFTKVRGHKYLRFPSYSKYFFKNLSNMSKCDNLLSLTVLNGRKFVDFNFYNYFSHNVRNLETLIIRNEILLDAALQAIFKNLTKLKILILDDCCFSDYAFSGYNAQTNIRDGYSVNNLCNLKELTMGSRSLKTALLKENIIFPKLEHLGIREQKNLSFEALVSFIENCPNLKVLQLAMEVDNEWINSNNDLKKLKKTITYDERLGKIDYWYRIKDI